MEKEKYELVLEEIEKGGQTMETLMTLLEAKSPRAITNQFKFINVMKKYPYFDEEKGEFVILGPDDWEKVNTKAKADKEAEKKWTANPQNKRTTLESRLNAKVSRMNAAKRKLEADPDDTALKLKNTIAVCEFHLANLTLSEFQQKMTEELGISLDVYKDIADLDAAQEDAKVAG